MKRRSTSSSHLFIDMSSGVAGDMLLAALIDLEKDKTKQQQLISELRHDLATLLAPEIIDVHTEPRMKHGLRALGLKFVTPEDDWNKKEEPALPHNTTSHSHNHAKDHTHTKEHPHHHHAHTEKHSHHHAHAHTHTHTHRTFKVIAELLAASHLSQVVKKQAHAVFLLLAQSEGTVHGMDPLSVHFHEVGSLDAICEIVGVCLLLEAYQIETVYANPLVLGSGTVKCAHGLMPVPVPAVVEMIARSKAPFKKISATTGELTTPTGAALILALAQFVDSDNKLLSHIHHLNRIGWGAGTKDIKYFPNIIRVMLLSEVKSQKNLSTLSALTPNKQGNQNPSQLHPALHDTPTRPDETLCDEIIEIKTTLDDVTGENISILLEKLLAAGALDVHATQVMMKKSRPGISVTVLVLEKNVTAIGKVIFMYSPAIGYRFHRMNRHKLARKKDYVTVNGIKIAIKIVYTTAGNPQVKGEADAVRHALEKLPTMTYHELEYRIKEAYYHRKSS
ncbi:hypothetical protein COTS27_01163 [Spirochaetota bacterium]|nr:hypothetical protein COTS27_01163 [Spirochaetota bacterium]